MVEKRLHPVLSELVSNTKQIELFRELSKEDFRKLSEEFRERPDFLGDTFSPTQTPYSINIVKFRRPNRKVIKTIFTAEQNEHHEADFTRAVAGIQTYIEVRGLTRRLEAFVDEFSRKYNISPKGFMADYIPAGDLREELRQTVGFNNFYAYVGALYSMFGEEITTSKLDPLISMQIRPGQRGKDYVLEKLRARIDRH